jgi:hypothetical protein
MSSIVFCGFSRYVNFGFFTLKQAMEFQMSEVERKAAQDALDHGYYDVSPGSLDALGEKEVLHRQAKGEFGESGSVGHSIASAWLESKKVERSEETLSISRKALANSKSATVIARIAIGLSIIMAIQKFIEWYFK